jgi:hypothetical protein
LGNDLKKNMPDFILTRGNNTPDGTGIFGSLVSSDGLFSCVTLERLFDGSPKIATGTYTCHLGTFTLEGYQPAQYFQLLDVPNCTDILIHFANYSWQLNGCIAVGATCVDSMITSSDATFNNFMSFVGTADFNLTVL